MRAIVILALLVLFFSLFFGCTSQSPENSSINNGVGVENNLLSNEGGQVEDNSSDSLNPSPASSAELENKYSGTCPRGLTNDPYPGVCGQYVDETNDGICDRSQ